MKTIQAAVTIDWMLPEKSGFLQNSMQEKQQKAKTKQQTELFSTALPEKREKMIKKKLSSLCNNNILLSF